MISVPEQRIKEWLAGNTRVSMYAGERKLIWLAHCLIFAPERLRSLFDIATFGRYLPDDMTGLPTTKTHRYKRGAGPRKARVKHHKG